MDGACPMRAVKANLGALSIEEGECLSNPVVESRMTNRLTASPRAERCWIASHDPNPQDLTQRKGGAGRPSCLPGRPFRA
jgi:hypothetical protein